MIFAAGSWRPAELLDWRTTERATGEWRAYVTYTVGVGQKYLHWIDGERVRRVAPGPEGQDEDEDEGG